MQPTNDNIISQLWAKYFPYWPVFLLLICLALGGAWFYLQYKLPVYESTAKLLIKDEKRGIEDSKMMESLNTLSSKKIIENETEVIKSRALMSQVVNQLNLYAPIFEEANWKDIPAYTISPVKIEVQQPDSLIETKRMDFIYNAGDKTILLQGKKYPLDQWVTTGWGVLRFTANNKSYRFTKPLYFSLINQKRVIQNLIKSLEVIPAGKLSTVVVLKLKDAVPEQAEDVLNALIAAYDRASVNDRNTLAQNTLEFLDERLAYVTNDLDSIEKKLQQYKAGRGAINLSSQGQLFLQNVSENDQKLSDVNMKMAVLKQVEQYVFSKDRKGGLVPSTLGVDDPLLSNLLNRLYDAELQYEKLKRTTGENNPDVVSLSDQIERIRPGILENIRSQQLSLEANKRNLFSTNNSYSTLLQALPQQEQDLVEISRQQNIKSSIYSFLLQKREETALSHSSTVSETRVVDKAESSLDPVGWGSKIIYAIAAMLALGLGIALVSGRELFNHTILFRKEIEAVTFFPVIGEISKDKSKSSIMIEAGTSSFIAEEFRHLRTSLHYLGIGSNAKRILITSSISGEGKSFVAVNLAMSLAISGKKVILVEFDLKNPTLAFKLGIEGNKGISDYLAGNFEADEVIRSIGNNTNLFIITSGNLPDNPSELILNTRTIQLLDYLNEKFDFVIVDSAAVGILSDGYILSRYCDATLYIVRHGLTPKRIFERLEKNNKINELKNLAIIFNGVQSRGFGFNGYGYGYGYGYLYNYQKKKRRVVKM